MNVLTAAAVLGVVLALVFVALAVVLILDARDSDEHGVRHEWEDLDLEPVRIDGQDLVLRQCRLCGLQVLEHRTTPS